MYITDLNEAGGIGANSLFLEIGPFRVLVDCGMHPKAVGNSAVPRYDKILSGTLDLIILTHCHLDHLGSLPIVSRAQPQAEVWLSPESAILAPRMMRNSVRVMSRQREEQGIAEYPLYTNGEVSALESKFRPIVTGRTRVFHEHGEDLEITFYHAGHIPGAVSVLISYKKQRILFSGDILFNDTKILAGATLPDVSSVDVLVLETTRGGTERLPGASRNGEVERLVESIADTIRRGGCCLLPVFALGRMQEILSVLYEARRTNRIPECPVYTSGLGMDIANYFDQISKKSPHLNFRKKILKDLGVRKVPREIVAGRSPAGPAIYLASSGMLVENTPSYLLASALLEEASNSVFFVGYCDPDAPGYALIATPHGQSVLFKAYDYEAVSRARIDRFDLSSHADRDELMNYALSVNPRTVFLTHGDPEAREWFETELYTGVLDCKVIDPDPLERTST